jgi:hypothetical protein
MKTSLKYLRKFLLIIGIFIATVLIFLAIIGVFYGDKAKQIILAEIGKKLNIEVSVKEINFSLFKNFPDASLELIDIQTNEKLPGNIDPLLKARKLYLLFDIFDIITGNYTIEKIVLNEASMNLVVLNDSLNNFSIFHKQEGRESASVNLNLQKVYLNDVLFSYHQYPAEQEYIFRVKKGNLKGAFTKQNYVLEMEGNLVTRHFRSGENIFLTDREFNTRLVMNVDRQMGLYTFREAMVTISGIKVNMTGTILDSANNKILNLTLQTEKAKIPTLLDLIPEEFQQSMKDYSMDGDFALIAKIEGEFTGNVLPHLSCDFSLDKGKFADQPSGLTFRNVSFKGQFDNGPSRDKETCKLKLYDFKAGIKTGQINGELTIINFLKPTIATTLTSSINLDKLDEILHIEALESISGQLDLNLTFNSSMKNLRKFTIDDFISSQTSGSLKIKDVSLKMKNSTVLYHNLSGSFKFNNKDLLVEDFSGKINESDFNMKGSLLNILAYAFLPGKSIKIKADFSSESLNLDDLLSFRKDKSGTRYRMKFSDLINFNLDLNIKDFTFGTFKAKNLKGNAIMKQSRLQINSATLYSMEGKTILSGFIDGNYPDKFWISFNADLQDVNISKLFSDLGEFGQQNITSEQIRGEVNASIYYKSFIDPELSIDPKSVYALGDIVIKQGELINYSPLYKLSKYIKRHDLEHIRFSTLQNQIEIKEEVIYIPEMNIESSTLDLRIFGTHTFKNNIDYHVRILLSELLSKKEKKKEEEIEGIFPEEDGLGQTTLFLHMTGNAEDPDIKYDTKEVRKKISADMKEEKQEMKNAFMKEFGRKENGQVTEQDGFDNNKPDAGKNFKIEWDENQPPQAKQPDLQEIQKKQQEKKSTKKEFIIEWDEEKDTLK